MKIQTDSTWHKILDEDGSVAIDFARRFGSYAYHSLIKRILNKSQQVIHEDRDAIFTLSKKAEKILKEEIEKHKQIKNE